MNRDKKEKLLFARVTKKEHRAFEMAAKKSDYDNLADWVRKILKLETMKCLTADENPILGGGVEA